MPCNILLIEDSREDTFLVTEYLSLDTNFDFSLFTQDNLKDSIAFIAENKYLIDIILLDLQLPDSSGFVTFQEINSVAEDTCIILLTGLDDHKIAKMAIEEGAQDYLVKQDLNSTLLIRSILYALQRKKTANEIHQLNENLEKLVEKRTSQLKRINESLLKEITQHKETAKFLKQSQARLKDQSKRLEKKNTTLKELLYQFENEKKEVERRIYNGIQELVKPIIDRMKTETAGLDRAYIELLENAIEEVIGPASQNLTALVAHLSPKEVQVFQMVRSGFQTKEISKLLGISHHTVTRHRYNIRKKLGANRSKISIRDITVN